VSRDFRRANTALFLAGLITFATLYTYQPLFPSLVDDFGIRPTVASLALSVTTLALAVTLPIAGSLSDAMGRRAMMSVAVLVAPALVMASTAPLPFAGLLALRLVQGVVLAGVPGVAMAYLADEAPPRYLPAAMGLYIAGNAVGGMTGRIVTAWLADLVGWRLAVLSIGAASLLMGVAFVLLLPPSRGFRRRPLRLWPLTLSLLGHLRHPGLLGLYCLAFAAMGGFVTLYNYVSFRLLGPGFGLSQSQVALIFLAYAGGAVGSTVMGGLVARFGRGRVLTVALLLMTAGTVLTLPASLPAVAAGIAVFTAGFFGVHTLASSGVGPLAGGARAQASSLYLFFYYLGSSVSGTGGGLVYERWAWPGVVALVLATVALAVAAAVFATVIVPRSRWAPPVS
jgi:YNFM family putative membrane transporter